MGRSSYLNVSGARNQDAYFAKIRAAAHELMAGTAQVPCPRGTCGELVNASQIGALFVLRCPSCGMIFRGNVQRLLAHYEQI
jgi:predicted RNA-binding Zn-ribbon protein involved in translation (DUF1610 family)